ncbi:cell division protein FtsK [Streptococcus salivarius]|uniref:FtsK/SpoIIIE family coupling protein n=1 Tax=Streptococcus salivarius TaxID=1304 RepID=A0A1R3TDE1_STRSL|nr:FtsK/SpoIIIE domain-containing protein [Streptococcus salivarius]MEB3644668.1 FtsK/SpoIIIE domain-containing protein [Streptococcus salivarius]MTQ92277.1 cell division protein FtsK [Streptococcus salivarius]SCW20748.1 FtsK/SpoIIIE family coupling protein [Streptococcus salivarius]
MKLFTYRGIRVRAFYRHIRGITWFIWWFPSLLAIGHYCYLNLEELKDHPLPQVYFIGGVLVASCLVAYLLNHMCYEKIVFFQKLNSLRILSRFLIENNLYLIKNIRRENKTIEKIDLPQVYLKQSRYKIEVCFILEGNKFQDRFLNLGSTLEVMFNGDFRNKTFDKRFITYDIAINRIDSRISINEVEVKGSKLQLMKDVTWDYIEEPHLLIGGGTGGGKTVVLMTIIYALAKIGFVDICDPKNSDLAGLKKIPVFHGRVYTSKEDIIQCFKENVAFMEKRYELMSSSPKFQAGKNFTHYGMTPKFILVDEWAALMAKIDRDYSLQSELMEYLSQLVLEGRQAGVFIIFAMQRPDGEFIKTALRDNFMKRLSVGHLESTGYDMMFGDANKTKEFKKLDEINGVKVKGRGYIANNGDLAGEFFSPYVPLDQGFSFYEAYAKIPIMEFNGEEFEVFGEVHQQSKTIESIEEEEALSTETNQRPLKEFAEEQDLKMATLRKIIYLLQEQGIVFERTESAILVDPFQEELLLESLIHFEEGGRKSYPKAVEATLSHHGLGQGQGQA